MASHREVIPDVTQNERETQMLVAEAAIKGARACLRRAQDYGVLNETRPGQDVSALKACSAFLSQAALSIQGMLLDSDIEPDSDASGRRSATNEIND